MKRLLILATMATLAVSAQAVNLIQNGSFETGTDPGGFHTVLAGQGDITGWTVGGHSVDYIGTYWNAQDGSRSVDLSGNDRGKIGQWVNLAAGTYTLSFWLSGNPDNNGQPSPKLTELWVGGVLQNTYSSPLIPVYQQYSFNFSTAGGNTFIEFAEASGNLGAGNAYGAVIDNVSLEAVPEPFTMGLGLAAAGAFVRRRLKSKSA